MKKFISIALMLFLLVSMAGLSAFAANSFTASAGTCVVDGVKDAAYVSAAIPINYNADSSAATGEAYAAWDDAFLYIFIAVRDSAVTSEENVTSIWSNDCTEIYINLSGTEGDITTIDAGQYTYGPSFTEFAGRGGHHDKNKANAQSAYTYTDNGYTVEIALPWGTAYTPAAGASIPFCAAVNDDSDGDASTREYQTFTGASQDFAYMNADSTWDSLTLSSERYTEPAADTTAPVMEPADTAAADSAPAPTAPQTSDEGALMAVLALLFAGLFTMGMGAAAKRNRR